MKAQILGTGHAVPERILTNQELETMVDTSHEWIIERTGILERRIADPGIKNSDLSFAAAQMAMQHANIGPEDLDLIIVGTTSPDMVFPSTACILQDRLGAKNAAAFDLEAGCTGFIYSLTVAEKFLLSPEYKYILVVGVDLCSRFTDYTDRNTCVIFGDGAGAAVVGKSDSGPGIIDTFIGAEGSGGKHLYMPAGGSNLPPTAQTVEQRLHYIKMDGNEIFRFATKMMVKISEKMLTRSGLEYKDVDFFIPHQANIRIIKTAMKRMNIPAEKTLINIHQFGNMSAACIPVGLSTAWQEGRIKDGDLVLMVAFGAGLTYGGILLRWGRA
ncbi:MAG: beta-ketoacyl-ACP synthase III [Syntrophomonas sp.]